MFMFEEGRGRRGRGGIERKWEMRNEDLMGGYDREEKSRIEEVCLRLKENKHKNKIKGRVVLKGRCVVMYVF